MNFADRIMKLMEERKVSAYRLSKDIGISDSLIGKWRKNKNAEPSAITLHKISEYFQVTMEWLLTGKDSGATLDISDDEVQLLQNYRILPEKERYKTLGNIEGKAEVYTENIVESKPSITATLPQIVKSVSISLDNEFAEDKYIEMIVHDQPSAAGLGNYLDDYSTHEEIKVRASDVPYKASFGIRIVGDSMNPKIEDGDIVWVEGRPQIENNEIGIFILNNESFCKKLKIEYGKEGRTVSLVSLNPNYKPIEIDEGDDLRTVGRVLV